MFRNAEKVLGMEKTRKTLLRLKEQLLLQEEKILEEERELEKYLVFDITDMMSYICTLVNMHEKKDYKYKMLTNKNGRVTNYIYILIDNDIDIEYQSDLFWEKANRREIIILGNKKSRSEPKKMTFGSRSNEYVRFNQIDNNHLEYVIPFVDRLIAYKIENQNLDTSLQKINTITKKNKKLSKKK